MTGAPHYKIALLLRHRFVYGREIIAGIAAHLSATRATFSIFLSDDFAGKILSLESMHCDGVIVDFDDEEFRHLALNGGSVPVVAIGSSFDDISRYPKNIPYVATDNVALIAQAHAHLIDAGLSDFAMMSVPQGMHMFWAVERERTFTQLMQKDRLPVRVFRASNTVDTESETELIAWVKNLPKPIGIIAVNDARGRQLLQACELGGIPVPKEVAAIGVDNDILGRALNKVPLSSMIQGTDEMGRTAARLLLQRLRGIHIVEQVLVPPSGIASFASTQYDPTPNAQIMRARYFIRQYACEGIRTQQVADHVDMSRSSLEAHFRQELGVSVHDEILRFKLEAAKAQLSDPPCDLTDVALSCGFTSVPYMHNVFKRELGCTPREYQARQALMLVAPKENNTVDLKME